MATAAPTLEPCHVLLVEDSPSDAALLEAQLRDGPLAAAEVVRATTLREAVAALSGASFDAVLVDLGLPDSDGLDTFVSVADAAAQSAVVVITGLDDARLAEEAVRRGAGLPREVGLAPG